MLDIDYRGAYDMVPYFIKEMAPRGMGCPDELIKTWMGNDPTRKVSIKTPFGNTKPLTPKAGGCAQGAEESPMIFVLKMKSQYLVGPIGAPGKMI